MLHVFKVDVGDGVIVPVLQHAASQAPLLSVAAELQDLGRIVIVNVSATWI